MTNDFINRKKVEIDLDYLMPDTSFIYPIYSTDGEKLLEGREVLTQSKIKSIKEKHGSKVYYTLPDKDSSSISSHVFSKALVETKNVIDDIIINNKFTQNSYKKSEEVIEEILQELNSKDVMALTLLKEMKSYDEYLYSHAINVGLLSAILARKRRIYKGDEIKKLVIGAYLSDLGKIQVDKNIINKPDKLSHEEQIQMRLHPQLGYNMLKALEDVSPIILQTVLFHHERFDDEGYYNLPYDSLPSSPKIVSICDMYDALTSSKPYRQAYSPSEAMKIIVNSVDKQFDRDTVSSFINVMGVFLNNSQSFYRKGDFCILSTGEVAIISGFNAMDLLKPKVIIFAKFENVNGTASLKFFTHPIEVDLQHDFNRNLSTFIMQPKLIDVIKEKLKEKRMLTDFLFMTLPDWH